MKILLIDAGDNFLDFALRCEAFGHEVRVFMGPNSDGSRFKAGDGLINKIGDWEPSMKWADLIVVSDNAKYSTQLEKYRKMGFPIFNSHKPVAEWELNRGTGIQVFEQAGIKTIPSEVFTDYDKAIAFVEKNSDKRYVSKPSGDADKALSYVSKSAADMIFMLEYWKKQGKIKSPFLLQEFKPGIEMAVSGWFGKNGFSKYFLENFEFKKLMPSNYGPNTGESGTLMKYVTESKLADEVLKPLAPQLFKEGYVGFIDVAVIIQPEAPWPMDHSVARFGWPLFQIQQILHPEPVQWMFDLFDGEDTFKPCMDIACGVVVAFPPYPYHSVGHGEGYPIWGINEKNRYFIHPAEMMLSKTPMPDMDGDKVKRHLMMVSSGVYPVVCSGRGDTVKEACKGAFGVIDELVIPNSPIVRDDIGERLKKEIPELQKMGYATEWEYE